MARLISNIREWINRDHGKINYCLTQFFSGHGYFNAYLARMDKVEDATCQYEASTEDDAHHFFEWERWSAYREALQEELGPLTPDNIMRTMLSASDHWQKIAKYIEKVLKEKKRETQAMEAADLG